MNYIQTEIDGVWLIEPKVLRDERGYFMEAFKEEEFKMHIGDVHFIQDNESKSSFGVLRGLHYQKGEYCQSKLVRVIKGKVLDVAVDLRQSSPTFGKYVSAELSEENQRQFFIPRGFAHGSARRDRPLRGGRIRGRRRAGHRPRPVPRAGCIWCDRF